MKRAYNLIVEITISFFIIIGLAVSGAIISVNTSAQGEGASPGDAIWRNQLLLVGSLVPQTLQVLFGLC